MYRLIFSGTAQACYCFTFKCVLKYTYLSIQLSTPEQLGASAEDSSKKLFERGLLSVFDLGSRLEFSLLHQRSIKHLKQEDVVDVTPWYSSK